MIEFADARVSTFVPRIFFREETASTSLFSESPQANYIRFPFRFEEEKDNL